MAWTKAKTTIAVAAAMLLAAGTTGLVVYNVNRGEREAQALLEKVARKYMLLTSYSSTGTTIENINGKTLTATFGLRLGRTNRYLVRYEQQAPTFTNQGTVWNDGTGNYFANEAWPTSSSCRTGRQVPAWSTIWGISQGFPAAQPFLSPRCSLASQSRMIGISRPGIRLLPRP